MKTYQDDKDLTPVELVYQRRGGPKLSYQFEPGDRAGFIGRVVMTMLADPGLVSVGMREHGRTHWLKGGGWRIGKHEKSCNWSESIAPARLTGA